MKKNKGTIDGSDNELTKKIATAALCFHLNQNDKTNEIVAVSALAMYLKSHGQKTSAKLLAQVALAIHLQNEPESFYMPLNISTPVGYANSAWGNKILLMRQLPIRK